MAAEEARPSLRRWSLFAFTWHVSFWVGWSLWSLMPAVGLGQAAKALALSAYRARKLDGVTQYDNSALKVQNIATSQLIPAASQSYGFNTATKTASSTFVPG